MSCLSIQDLATFTGGHLRLGVLPPLGGVLEPIGRVQTELNALQEGDIYWQCGSPADVHAAYACGALGVVHEGERIEPWAGRFALQVRSAQRALQLAAMRSRRQYGGCLVAVVDFASDHFQQSACREFVHQWNRHFPSGTHAEPCAETEVAREIIHLDEQRPFAVFNLYRQSSQTRRNCLERLQADLIVTTHEAAGELPENHKHVIYADDYSTATEVAHAALELASINIQPEPCEALPTMLGLRESDMPTLLGRSNQLADWWLLGRSPWRVLPGRA